MFSIRVITKYDHEYRRQRHCNFFSINMTSSPNMKKREMKDRICPLPAWRDAFD